MHKAGEIWTLGIANEDNSTNSIHKVKIKDQTFEWQGPFEVQN